MKVGIIGAMAKEQFPLLIGILRNGQKSSIRLSDIKVDFRNSTPVNSKLFRILVQEFRLCSLGEIGLRNGSALLIIVSRVRTVEGFDGALVEACLDKGAEG